MLDASIQNVFHVRKARMCEYRPIAQCTRAPFHPSLEPSDHISVFDLFSSYIKQTFAVERFVFHAVPVELRLYRRVTVLVAEISVGHDPSLVFFEENITDVKRRTECKAIISGSRLDAGFAERCFD